MSLAIENLIKIIILLVVIVAVIYIFVVIGRPIGQNTSLQADLQNCCTTYRANGCPGQEALIICPSGNAIGTLASQLGYSNEQLNATCGC